MGLDEKDLETIKELIKADREDASAAMAKEIGKAVKGLKLADTIKAEVAKLAPPADDDGEDGPRPGEHPTIAGMRKELAKIKKRAAEQTARAEAVEKQSRAEKRNNAFRTAYEAAGGDPKRFRVALNHALGEGLLDIDDEGAVTFNSLPVERAAKAWLASEEGRVFVPPKRTEGPPKGGKPPASAAGVLGRAMNGPKTSAPDRGGDDDVALDVLRGRLVS
jgi:hypothetical protein